MASGNIAPQHFRKALGALKDSTKVGMAIVNSEYKDMDVAVVKATNHDEVLPKEKHVRKIFQAVSSSSPRTDVSYCIHALARRLSKTHTWIVALKTLIVIHRGLREVDSTFQQELISYNESKGHLLNLSHFKDDSSPSAWENSSWVRCYALYLEESLECFRTLEYDIQKEQPRTKGLDTARLLEELPRLQQLLSRLLDCQPIGAPQHNFLIQQALSKVAAESVKLYVEITDGVLRLVDKFFEMQRLDAIRALEIYKKSGKQGEKLSEFFEMCRSLDFGRGQNYAKIEQPPESFLEAMEDYVMDAPQAIAIPLKANDNDKLRNPKAITAGETSLDINHEPVGEMQKCSDPSVSSLDVPTNDNNIATYTDPIADLLNLENLPHGEPISADTNALALAVATPDGDQSNTTSGVHPIIQSSSWELELVSAPSSQLSAMTRSTMGGGIDRLTLDTLYDAALAKTNPIETCQVVGVSSNPFEESADSEHPFSFPVNFELNTDVQELHTPQNEQLSTQQQQQNMSGNHASTNPFGNPFVD